VQGIVPGDCATAANDEVASEAWSALVEIVADGVLETECGAIVRANAQVARLLGHGSQPDKLVGLPVEELLEPLGQGSLECDAHRAVSCRVVGSDSARQVDVRTRVLSGSRAVHLVTEAERAGAVSSEMWGGGDSECREAHGVCAGSTDPAADRMEFIEVMCHELRTPITVIRGYAKLLLSSEVGPLNDQQRRFLEESAKSCRRLDDFVELLTCDIAKGRAALADPTVVEGSLAPVLEEAIDYLRPMLQDQGVCVEFELAPNALRAWFDASRIEQIVANLVDNALKHTASPVLLIHTRAIPRDPSDPNDAGPWVEIGVSDRGPGLSEFESQRIFEPYVRGQRSSSSRGIGLGLSICRRIVEAHGGRIAVRPTAEGSCFAFTLPAADPTSRSLGADREG